MSEHISLHVTKAPRADKKTMVKATLPVEFVDALTERAAHQGYTTKRNGEMQGAPSPYAVELIRSAIRDELCITTLAPYFRRAYFPVWDKCRVMMGRVIAPKLSALMPEGKEIKRLPVKFSATDYAEVGAVAYSLGCSDSQACTILIAVAILQGIDIPDKDELHGEGA